MNKHLVFLNRIVLFLVFTLLSYGNANADGDSWYHLKIGFSLDYPDRVHFSEPALAEIERLGVRDVRIYEIFDGRHGNEYQARLKNALDHVLAHGMRPLITISNVPSRLKPKENEREKLVALLPSRVAQRIPTILTYSNHFPPTNWQGYRASIQELVNFLFNTYGSKRVRGWTFEIGGEPDSPSFFWGSSDQFAHIYQIAAKVLHANGIRNVGGYGVTNHPIFLDPPLERSRAYRIFLKDLAGESDQRDFLSFHFYQRKSNPPMPLSGLPFWLSNTTCPVMITEWNVSSVGAVAAKIFAQPGAWGAKFIRMLADCERYGVDRLYIFKLMDYPLQRAIQLGAFDREGEPKPWFAEFVAIYKAVREGYRVSIDARSITLEGKTGLRVVLAKTDLPIPMPIQYAPIASERNGRMIHAGEWAIVSYKHSQEQQ